jgi:DNA-directed RNA polymerase specialized sigma24 family protein
MPASFPDTRWSLIARSGGGAGELLALYADPVARYLAQKFPDAARDGRLDDIVQEVLLWLATHPEVLAQAQPGPGSRFRWYVMTLAFNQARNVLRQLKRPDAPRGDAPELSANADETRAMDRAWAEALIADAWRDLAGWAEAGACEADVPRILRLHLGDGLGMRETAAAADIPLATCHRRIAAGRALLRRAIIDRLRLAGEVADGDDAASACDLLLAMLR